MSTPVSNLSLLPLFLPGDHKFVFYLCDCYVNKFICATF